MAPRVLAAYTPPTSRAGSSLRDTTDASANGKLAPQSTAPGRTAYAQRMRSSWNCSQGSVSIDGLIGQNGSDCISAYAVHAIAAESPNWHNAKATRGRSVSRATIDPSVLPMPRPARNTARINENVYTVAPSINDSSRVQTTWAASAVMPDNAMATYTGQRSLASTVGAITSGWWRALEATANARSATTTFSATAAYVAVAASKRRRR